MLLAGITKTVGIVDDEGDMKYDFLVVEKLFSKMDGIIG